MTALSKKNISQKPNKSRSKSENKCSFEHFFFIWTNIMQFWQFCQKSRVNSVTFFRLWYENFRYMWKCLPCSSQKTFIKTFVWSRRMDFWQPWQGVSIGCQKFLTQLLKKFLQVSTCSKKKLKMFFWTRRRQFSRTCWIFFSQYDFCGLKSENKCKNNFF